MTPYNVTRDIAAGAEAIWAILTNPKRLADGTFSILRIEGAISAGQTISLWSEVAPKQKFRIKVEKVGADEMIWASGMPFGLFRGTRRFGVDKTATGARFTMTETYTGPLAGRMVKMIPDLQPSFETFADGLKRAAEGMQ